jgi:hypothetical protein
MLKIKMHTYKSYIGNRSQVILENQQEKTAQILGLEKMIAEGVVKTRHWYWDEENLCINFDSEVEITHKFDGDSFLDLPFKFGWCESSFTATGLDSLKSLEGSPTYAEDFDVSYCGLRSLKGSPKWTKEFNASHNLIASLEGCTKYIFGNFKMEENMLKSLDHGPYLIDGYITTRIKKETSDLFKEMHKIIKDKYIYVNDYEKTIDSIEKAIRDKTYVHYLMAKNAKFSQFLGDFPIERDELGFLGNVQDYGLM